ncbi:MAG: type II secretion system F family protein [Myxococcota bacterium]
MALYEWVGKDRIGEERRGVLDAPGPTEAENILKGMGVNATSIKKKKSNGIIIPGFTKVPVKSKVVFTRQLATMIDAGLPLVQCLEILGNQEPDPLLQQTVLAVKQSVEGGTTFADALAKHPKVFDNLFVNLIAAGEVGGILDTILNRLAAYMEKAMKLKQKVKGAMKYPVTVLVVSLTITGFLLVKVIPTFSEMFESMGKDLPALTANVVAISDWAVANLHIVLTILASIFVAFKLITATSPGRLAWDTAVINAPVFGPLVKKAAVAKFTRTLGTLISSGVPILDALEIVARTAGNKVVENAVLYTREKISEGKSIAAPLMEQSVFPKMVVQMIAVGESTGAMDIMLTKIADFYDDEVDAAVDGMTSLIEPLIMVVLGGIISVVLLAMYLPIFNMADTFGK